MTTALGLELFDEVADFRVFRLERKRIAPGKPRICRVVERLSGIGKRAKSLPVHDAFRREFAEKGGSGGDALRGVSASAGLPPSYGRLPASIS